MRAVEALRAERSSASTASAMSSSDVSSSGEWLAPPFRLRTKSIAVGTPAAASTIASWPAPETSLGASGRSAHSVSNGAPLIATGSRRDAGSKPIAATSSSSCSAVGARASTATVTRAGTTFIAFGSTSTAPTVATAPSRAHSRRGGRTAPP